MAKELSGLTLVTELADADRLVLNDDTDDLFKAILRANAANDLYQRKDLIGFALKLNANQTIATATNTLVDWTASAVITYDDDGAGGTFFDAGGTTSRITIPAALNGKKMMFGFGGDWVTNTVGSRKNYLQLTGGNFPQKMLTAQGAAPDATAITVIAWSAPTIVSTADYVEKYCNQTSGGNLDLFANTWLAGFLV